MKKIKLLWMGLLVAGLTFSTVQAEFIQLGGKPGVAPVVPGTDYVVQFDGAYTNIGNGAFGASGTLGNFSGIPSSMDFSSLSLTNGAGLVATLADAENDPVTYNASLQMRPGSTVSFSFNEAVRLKGAGFAGDLPTNVTWGTHSEAISGNVYDFQDSELAIGETLTFNAPPAFRLLHLAFETLTSTTNPPTVTNLTLTVTDRAGTNVTGTLLVDSDHIHLETASPTNVVSYSYKVAQQTSEPTPAEWDALDSAPFHKDMWFYREPTNQWVRIFVADAAGSTLDEVVGLQGGVLTAPPDDPISPQEWIAGAQGGGYRNRNVDESFDIKAEGNIVLKKKYGFTASRIHMDMEAFRTGDTARIEDEVRRIKIELRHGIYITIAAQGDVPPLTDPAPGTDGKPMDTYSHLMEHTSYTPEMQNLFSNAWTSVAEVYKYFPHRVSFAYFIELRNGAQYPTLEAMHNHITPIIRSITPTRILDYQGKSRNEPEAFPKFDLYLPALETPYGGYYMYSFHKGFGGANDAWYRSQQDRNLSFLQPGIDYCNANPGKAVFMDVYNHTQGFYMRAQRIQHVKEFYDKLSSTPVPIPSICADFPDSNMSVDWQYDDLGNFRPESYYSKITLEILNGDSFVDANDRDGDTLSNDEEAALGTDSDWADTDYDGMYDHVEVQFGFDPLDPRDGIDPWNQKYGGDADGDGILNAWEVHYPGLDPFNPNDARTDLDGDTLLSVYEAWARTEADNSRNAESNEEDDSDGDGTLDAAEWAAGTNPLDDEDPDLDGIISGDTRPFISDAANVIRYEFNAAAADTARYGADNAGTLLGGAIVTNGMLQLGSGDSAAIPSTDLTVTDGHGVYLRFNAVNLPHDYQVIYSEGDATNGLAVYLYKNEVWAGCWVDSVVHHLPLGTVVPGQWHMAALSFDGGEGGALIPWLTGYFDGVRVPGSPIVPTFGSLNARSSATLGTTGTLPLTRSGLGGAELVSGIGFNGWIDDVNVFNRVLYDIDVSMLGDRLYAFDTDADGVLDISDAFPGNGSETRDADHDGIGDSADLDDDNDGMSDALENLYGFDPLDPSDADGDEDEDGMSNGDEIFAGTHPVNPDSLFMISSLDAGSLESLLQWSSISGRTYAVEYSDDLLTWSPLPDAESLLASGIETGVIDSNETIDVRFYRVGVLPE
ncbi:LamG-like jellyroll fold domain-containing protein [Pontiella sulfatireligans]|uniref:LamG-like jellyroll fold domain-containing protein n=1 Tax=Pontiella sulfatireligans TaxID=2750658 RepID=A0A6C2UD35_9BACT|nr:LamG-like jellyroll fold domain-containing protein [Pontiella sulfatireligans]VGO18035.1 hypothetical protein SCARR_00085 [Pontiella sulfatireligans]